MISVAGRSASLASALKGSSQVVATSIKGVVGASTGSVQDRVISAGVSSSGGGFLKNAGMLTGSSGIGVGAQIRCGSTESASTFKEIRDPVGGAHYDIPAPNFDDVRHASSLDPTVTDTDAQERRKAFSYMMVGTSLAGAAYLAKNTVRGIVGYLGPAADCLAAGSIEVNISNIPEGKSVTFKWRGKPLFVKHRTDAEIKKEEDQDLSQLRDPEHDSARVIDPKYLILIGICTHLGCVPIADAGDYGGYYCPCHGSHYDGSGRIRKGPAPLNLEVPPYSFQPGGMLIVGS